jgi:hypothetical protein
MSDKNLQQRLNINFCVKIGKSASETTALLIIAYSEYAMKKSNVLNDISGSRKGGKMFKMTHEGQMQTLVRSDRILGETYSRRTEYGNPLGGKDPKSGLCSPPWQFPCT